MNGKTLLERYSDFTAHSPFDFALHSSIGCGGTAKIVFYPRSVAEMVSLTERLERDGIAYYVLGNLTNVLPPDGECDKAIVCTREMNGASMGKEVFVYAGATSGAFLHACRMAGKTGAEFLSGIPCTMGGALYMNAGAAGRYISEIVKSVLVLRNGKTQIIRAEDCGYAYKQSVFMENKDVILGASLALESASREEIFAKEREYLERRRHLPKGRSMGCVFKNPVEGSAGAYVEGSGLKGFRVGGAKISEEHANFIINEGGATAKDIRTLIAIIKNAVRAQYKIELQEEIRYL